MILAFQFKLIHNIVNCRSNLRKWNISDSDTCEFCSHGVPDDIIHALYQCEYSTKFLTDIFSLIDPQNDLFIKDTYNASWNKCTTYYFHFWWIIVSYHKVRMKMKFICFCTHLRENAKKKTHKNKDAKKKPKQRRKFLKNDVNLAVASTVV